VLDDRIVAPQPLPVCVGHKYGDAAEPARPFDLHTKHVRVASGDRQDRSMLEDCLHSAVIDMSDRIPQQRTPMCHYKLGGLADPDCWFGLDPY
jgi:hypothetical protein